MRETGTENELSLCISPQGFRATEDRFAAAGDKFSAESDDSTSYHDARYRQTAPTVNIHMRRPALRYLTAAHFRHQSERESGVVVVCACAVEQLETNNTLSGTVG